MSWGIYKGRRLSEDSVKKKTEFQGMTIHVDRPKGFIQRGTGRDGKEWSRTYQYDYGFIPRTMGGDQDGLDCFLGPAQDHDEAYWVMQKKPDGSFDEYKVMLGFTSREQAKKAYLAHIPASFFDGIVAMKTGMMRAMLGLEPVVAEKTARWLGFAGQLNKEAALSGLVNVLTARRRQQMYAQQTLKNRNLAAKEEGLV